MGDACFPEMLHTAGTHRATCRAREAGASLASLEGGHRAPRHTRHAVYKDTMKTEPSTRRPDVVSVNCVVGPENPRKPERVARCYPRRTRYPGENGVIGCQGQHKGGFKVSKDSIGSTLLFSENSFQDPLQLERPLWALARLLIYHAVILADVGRPAHTFGFLKEIQVEGEFSQRSGQSPKG